MGSMSDAQTDSGVLGPWAMDAPGWMVVCAGAPVGERCVCSGLPADGVRSMRCLARYSELPAGVKLLDPTIIGMQMLQDLVAHSSVVLELPVNEGALARIRVEEYGFFGLLLLSACLWVAAMVVSVDLAGSWPVLTTIIGGSALVLAMVLGLGRSGRLPVLEVGAVYGPVVFLHPVHPQAVEGLPLWEEADHPLVLERAPEVQERPTLEGLAGALGIVLDVGVVWARQGGRMSEARVALVNQQRRVTSREEVTACQVLLDDSTLWLQSAGFSASDLGRGPFSPQLYGRREEVNTSAGRRYLATCWVRALWIPIWPVGTYHMYEGGGRVWVLGQSAARGWEVAMPAGLYLAAMIGALALWGRLG